jgi:hypothetical protein
MKFDALFQAVADRAEVPADPAVWNDAATERIRRRINIEGIGPLLTRWERFADLPPPLQTEGRSQYRRTWAQNILYRSQMRDLLARGASRGLTGIPLKGIVSMERYPDPGLRPMQDIDLLVPPAERDAWIRFLIENEYRQGRHGHLHFYSPPPTVGSLDLHTQLHDLNGRYPWPETRPGTFDGLAVSLLDPVDELIYLTTHSLIGHGRARLLWLTDILLLIEQAPTDTPWHRIREKINGNRAHAAAIEYAIEQIEPMAERPLPAGLHAHRCTAKPRRWEDRLLRRCWESGGFGRGTGNLLQLLVLPPSRGRKLYAFLCYCFPTEAFIRRRYGRESPAATARAYATRPLGLAIRSFKLLGKLKSS